jgi:hypothetical protein
MSIGELWPGINELDEAGHEGTSGTTARDHRENLPPRPSSRRSNRETMEGVLLTTRRALLDDALGPSSTPPRGCGGGSARSKVARILSDAPRAISPRMRKSFVDRQYSPSTGMDRSEWEIILEELMCMRYIIKQELVSQADN